MDPLLTPPPLNRRRVHVERSVAPLHELAKDDSFLSKQMEEVHKILDMVGTFQAGKVLASSHECGCNKYAKDDNFLSKQIEEAHKLWNVADTFQKGSVLASLYEWDCNKFTKDESVLTKQTEEACKLLNMAGTFQKDSVLASSYECDCNLVSGVKKLASVPDLIGFLTNLRRVNSEYSLSHCLDNIMCVNTTGKQGAFNKQNRMEPKILTELKDLFMRTRQHENFETLLSQHVNELVERSNDSMILCVLQHPALRTLLNEFVCRSVPVHERKKTCTGGAPKGDPIVCRSVPICKRKKSVGSVPTEGPIACRSVPICEKKACVGSVPTEAPIACRSVLICEKKKACLGNVLKKAANLLCSTSKGAFVGQEENNMKSNKHEKARTRIGAGTTQPGDAHQWTTHQISHGELESWIVKHSMASKERKHEKPKSNFKKSEDDWAENGEDRQIEIEVELSGRSFSFLENEAAATDCRFFVPHVKHIVKTISLSRVNLDGQDEVLVLFKALRSDDKEIIVDNAYLRSTYPLLLVNFYEQNLHILGGNLLVQGMQ